MGRKTTMASGSAVVVFCLWYDGKTEKNIWILNMTDDELKALVASLAVAQQKTDEQMTRTDEQILSLLKSQKETDRKLEKASELANFCPGLKMMGPSSSMGRGRVGRTPMAEPRMRNTLTLGRPLACTPPKVAATLRAACIL